MRRDPTRFPRPRAAARAIPLAVAGLLAGLVSGPVSAQRVGEIDDPPGQVRQELSALDAADAVPAGLAVEIEGLLDAAANTDSPTDLRDAARRADALAARLGEPSQRPLRIALDTMAEQLRLRAVFGDAWACVELPESQGDHDFGAYYQPPEVDDAVRSLGAREGVSTRTIGRSLRGRPIHAVRVGTGDRVVLVQAGIHGNEATGTIAVIDLLRELADDSERSRQIRDAVTVVAIPMLNPDGAAHYQRENAQSWEGTVDRFPGLADGPTAYYHSLPGPRFWSDPRVAGFDVNRDFHPDFTYVPRAGDLPGSRSATGMYLTAEARASRDLHAALEDEFGLVDVFVDLHNQGPCNSYDHDGDPATPDRYTPMSISARMLRDPASHGAGTSYPDFDRDASRRANVAAWQALQDMGAPYANITRYPQDLDLAGSAVAVYQLRGSAGVLMEAGRQRHSNPDWRLDFLVDVHQDAIRGIVEALADGTFGSIDPDLYDAIPVRR